MNSVIGLFDYYNYIEWALEVLGNYDVDGGRISLVACDKKVIKPGIVAEVTTAESSTSSERGLFSFLADGPDALTFAIPGDGQMVVTGTLAHTLFTTINTTTVADYELLRALVNLGFSKEEAEFYVEGVKQGGILVIVETNVQNEYRIRAILRGAGAMDMNIYRHQTEQNKV